jgi:hypothetical protein
MRFSQGENLFFRKTLHHQLQFPPSVDTGARVLLHRGLRGKLFFTLLAFVCRDVWFPVGSESGNWMSVGKSFLSEYHAAV